MGRIRDSIYDDIENNILEIIVLIRAFIAEKKVGNIQVNMYMGGISSVNVNETKKLSD